MGGIGVLVFIHQHVAQLLLPVLANHLVLFQQLERQADEVVKVHALVSCQALFIAPHDGGGHALVFIGGAGQGLRGVEACVFPRTDGPLPLLGCGQVGRAAAVFQNTRHIVTV